VNWACSNIGPFQDLGPTHDLVIWNLAHWHLAVVLMHRIM